MNPCADRLAAFAFARAITPPDRPMPVVPVIRQGKTVVHEDGRIELKDQYLRHWRDIGWQDRAQTLVERRKAEGECRADAWGGMMQARPTVVVVDIDDADAMVRAHPEIARRYLREVPSPVCVGTARGLHLYYRVEGEAPALRTSLGGFDMKGARGLVFLPGSLSKARDCLYRLEVDGAEVNPRRFRPGELFARLPVFPLAEHRADLARLGLRDAPSCERRGGRDEADDRYLPDDEALDFARRYLDGAGPAVAGEGGHNKTRSIALCLGDFGVGEHVALEAMLAWDASNVPPWGPHALAEHVRDAYRTRKHPIGRRIDEVFGRGIVVA